MYSEVTHPGEPPWFSIVPVLCLAGLFTIISLFNLCKCSLYSCQSITCLPSALWKKSLLFPFSVEYYLWEISMCAYTCTGIHIVSAFMWPVGAVEMLVPTSATSYKLITILKAHCNIGHACDHLPIESYSDVCWYLGNRCSMTYVQKKR